MSNLLDPFIQATGDDIISYQDELHGLISSSFTTKCNYCTHTEKFAFVLQYAARISIYKQRGHLIGNNFHAIPLLNNQSTVLQVNLSPIKQR